MGVYVKLHYFFCNYNATTEINTYGHALSLHAALPISISEFPTASSARRWKKPTSLLAPIFITVAAKPTSSASMPARVPSTRFGTPLRQRAARSEEHTSELQSLMRISYAAFCLKIKTVESITRKQSTQERRRQPK